jgi:hypothetical protein
MSPFAHFLRKHLLGEALEEQPTKARGRFTRRLRSVLLVCRLALDESGFQHLLVTEPQIGDIG